MHSEKKYLKNAGKNSEKKTRHRAFVVNKAGYTATLVACGWVGAVLVKVTGVSGQEPYVQKAQKRQKSKKGTDRPTNRPTNQPTDRHSGV